MRLTAGVDDREADDDAKCLWILDDVIVTGDAFAAWDMPYVARGGAEAGEIDVTRLDRNQPFVQRGIFEVEDGTLRLCMAGDPDAPRPTAFVSTAANGTVLYVAKGSKQPLPT